MAAVIPRRDLTPSQEATIVSLLTIQPITKSIPQFVRSQPVKETFPLYEVDSTTIRLPYAFANVLLKRHPPNRIHHRVRLTFTKTLRPRQVKKVQQIDTLLTAHRTVTICGHTGFGKTLIATHYIAQLGVLTVVLVPGTQLMTQWPAALVDCLAGVRVGVVGETYDLDGWYDGTTYHSFETNVWTRHPDVLVCMPGRWNKIPEEVRDRVGLVLIDEAHMFCTSNRSPCLLKFQPKYVIAMTASPRRSDGTMSVIHALCGKHQVRARYDHPVTVWMVDLPIDVSTKKSVRGQTNWSGTVKAIVEDPEFNGMISRLIAHVVVGLKRKPIVMCDRKYHVEVLSSLLQDLGISVDVLMEDKNVYRDSQVLLAIMTKAGTGFDEQYACPDFGGTRIDTVIYCTSFKEINGLIQCGGRAFRADQPLIIHPMVRNGIIRNHWRECRRYYASGDYIKPECMTIQTWSLDGVMATTGISDQTHQDVDDE